MQELSSLPVGHLLFVSANPINFATALTMELLCLHLQCSPDLILQVLRGGEKMYNAIEVARRADSHRPRKVFEVTNEGLRQVHRTLAESLQDRVDGLGEHVQGFRRNRSIFTNAQQHCEKEQLATADIHEFFDNIGISTVVRVFGSLGCSPQTSATLAHLCCLDRRLPQGGRASPAISNLALERLDEEFVSGGTYTYTRYADDLAFSGERVPSSNMIEGVLQRHGFRLKPGSYRQPKGRNSRWVTGLNVSGSRPMIPQKKRRRIERLLHLAELHGPHAFEVKSSGRPITWLHGNLLWLRQYDPDGEDWWRRLRDATQQEAATQGAT